MQNQIPKNWTSTTIGGTATLNYGKSLPETVRNEGGVPVYGSSGINGYHNQALVNEESYIIGRKGTIGTISYAPAGSYPIDTVYYVPKSQIKCDFKFFYYLLMTLPLNRLNFDSAVPGLNRDVAYSQEITIPSSLKEQEKIASILSAFDDKIEVNNKIAKTLEEMAQAVFKEWFVNFKFPGYEKVKFADSELGKIPEGWRVSKLKEVLSVEHGYAFPSKIFKETGDYPVIKIKNIKEDNSIDLSDSDYIDPEDFSKTLEKFELKNGDILVAMTGATSGKVGLLVDNYNKYYLNQRVGKFTFRKDYYKWFCFIFLTREGYRDLLLSFSDGSAQGNLSPSQIESIEAVLPKNRIVHQFYRIISPFYRSQQKIKLENQKLAAMRDLLLPKLMRGEIRV